MNVYLAGRFHKRHVLHELGKFLEEHGHRVVSRWTLPNTDHVNPAGLSEQAADKERHRFAVEDIADIRHCDWMVSLMDEPRSKGRGGRHVEFGYALALYKKLTIIGPRETVFHHLAQVEHFETIDDFKKRTRYITR
jgi:nucleoside 2-deoxyribosyltransferase